MSNEFYFKLIIFALIAIIALELVAKKLKLPPAAAQLIGGAIIAFIPGIPAVNIDPEFILLIFLPPLLMDGAYSTSLGDFRKNISGILLLAIGAVLFTTLVIGYTVHYFVPSMPLAACFALGAIISPPDAIAAKAVLQHVKLPRQIMTLLEGESLLNDASAFVLYRFSIATVATGVFSLPNALTKFAMLTIGGLTIGAVVGYLTIKLIDFLSETYLVIIATVLPAWLCYILGEEIGVSGVIATVTYGMIIGWYQHEIVSASARRRGTAFWQVLIFLFESLVFILIGLSLRGVFNRLGLSGHSLGNHGLIVLRITGILILSRFIWIFALDAMNSSFSRFNGNKSAFLDWRLAIIKGWAGMRGVVTLAAALALPLSFPGRDLILITAFFVILTTVIIQGTTIGPLSQFLSIEKNETFEVGYLTELQSLAKIEAAQYKRVKKLAYNRKGKLLHPRLLEQYGFRAQTFDQYKDHEEFPSEVRNKHYDIILAAVAAGREELISLHRAGELHDELLHKIERDLDLQEIAARHHRGI